MEGGCDGKVLRCGAGERHQQEQRENGRSKKKNPPNGLTAGGALY
jgi:hypothetical protein